MNAALESYFSLYPPVFLTQSLPHPTSTLHFTSLDQEEPTAPFHLLPSQILLPNTIHPSIRYLPSASNQFPLASTTYQPSTYFQGERRNSTYFGEES